MQRHRVPIAADVCKVEPTSEHRLPKRALAAPMRMHGDDVCCATRAFSSNPHHQNHTCSIDVETTETATDEMPWSEKRPGFNRKVCKLGGAHLPQLRLHDRCQAVGSGVAWQTCWRTLRCVVRCSHWPEMETSGGSTALELMLLISTPMST